MADTLVFYHAPQSRSGGVAVLLEELQAPHELHVIDLKAGEQRQPAYLAINPLGKVPAIRHGDALITEQVAIYIYLADLFPQAGLAPPIGDKDRGPYLRWTAFYGSCFEPAMTDKALQREPGRQSMSPYGSFEQVVDVLTTQLRSGDYLLGARLSAADILWGGSLKYMVGFGLLPACPEITAYAERVTSRPSFAIAMARDAELMARRDKAS